MSVHSARNAEPRARAHAAHRSSSRLLRAFTAVALLSLAAVTASERADSKEEARTARGLDLWIHVRPEIAAGETLAINVEALGFPTATTLAALPGAQIEATWDPESLVDASQPKPSAAPVTVRVTADDHGRATLELPVPKGPAKAITLLVSMKHGDRTRVHEISVQRTVRDQFQMFLSDARVVPGSEVVAWALWTSRDRSRPVANAPIEYVLTQGGVVRQRVQTTSDASGTSMARVPIPRDNEPGAEWMLTARGGSSEEPGPEDSERLVAREETPGKPTFWSAFDEGSITAGGKAAFHVRARDAADAAIAGQTVWIWSGPRGTEAPASLEAFKKAATAYTTDGAGEVKGEIPAPTTIPARGTQIELEARTELEGQVRSSRSTIEVGERRGYVTLTPEGGEIVPGLEQRLVIALVGDDGEPLRGTFQAKADGLDATFTTNAHGEAEVRWKVPKGIGAARATGPCPGSVAAQVTLRAVDSPGAKSAFGGVLQGNDGMGLCVTVRREGTVIVRPEKLVARAGESLPITVLGGAKRQASVVATQGQGAPSVATWAADAGQSKEIKLPDGMSGVVTINVALPRSDGPTETASAEVMVLPKRLPKIAGKLGAGRAVPGGKVQIEAQLSDEKGAPLTGSVAAVMIDKLGGGSFGELRGIDTRESLCRELGVARDRCDEALVGGAEADLLRRTHLVGGAPLAPTVDPASNAKAQMDATFGQVMRSLEGAVFESSQALETQPDVRRKEGAKFVFNPELMTLVTDAMSEKPMTPGGEPVALADLIAIDNQISYDNVARRVTRLKLLQILTAARSARAGIDPDEPVLEDPNVFLRKLLREGSVEEPGLLDPWGGRIAFTKSSGEYIPFVSWKRGWELHAPGPDGKIGTGDDVKSPFERVLKSGTPYARALSEDEVVDARWDMLVSDATVASWESTLMKATGTALGGGGRGEGIGLGSIGTMGHGSGSGSGFGSGHGRVGFSMAKGVAYVAPPVRTDAQGKVTIDIPLGDVETTWQVALVALPDEGRPAMSTVDIPVSLPLSSKVQAGALWTDGDRGEAMVEVRNRTDRPLDVTLSLATSGTFSLDGGAAKRTVAVPKQGLATVRVALRAKGAGEGKLAVTTSAAGLPDDQLTHVVVVKENGELLRIARTVWVTDATDLSSYLERAPFVAQGPAELVLERGDRAALEDALESLVPENAGSPDALGDMAQAAGLLHAHFQLTDGNASKLAVRARDVGRAATAKLASGLGAEPLAFSYWGRAAGAGFLDKSEKVKKEPACVSEASLTMGSWGAALDAEPLPEAGGVDDCWNKLVARAQNALTESDSAPDLARAALAYARRPHRSRELKLVLRRLEELTRPNSDGYVSLPARATRADRAMVYAALLATTDTKTDKARAFALAKWLLVQRDTRGSFGNVAATRGAIQALIHLAEATRGDTGPVRAAIDFGDGKPVSVAIAQGEKKRVDVPKGAKIVRVAMSEGGSGGAIVRLERTYLRPYSVAPQPGEGLVHLSAAWPSAPECSDEEKKAKKCPTESRRQPDARAARVLRNGDLGRRARPAPAGRRARRSRRRRPSGARRAVCPPRRDGRHDAHHPAALRARRDLHRA